MSLVQKDVQCYYFFSAVAKLQKATITFIVSFRLSARYNSALTGQILMKFDIRVFFENLLREFNFHYNLMRIMGTLHEDQYVFIIIYYSVLCVMKNVSDKSHRENQNTHFTCIHTYIHTFIIILPISYSNIACEIQNTSETSVLYQKQSKAAAPGQLNRSTYNQFTSQQNIIQFLHYSMIY